MGVDLVGAAAGVDEVRAVAGVDEVLALPAVDAVGLRRRLAAGLGVAPQDVADLAGVDLVAAVAAEELVVLLELGRPQRAAAVGRPLDDAVDLGPAGMA